MDNLLVIHEVAELCRVHPCTVRRWLQSGRLKYKRAGRKLLFDPAEVARFIDVVERGAK
jgi:excisionase family DNA binding protein